STGHPPSGRSLLTAQSVHPPPPLRLSAPRRRFLSLRRRPPTAPLFPYTTLFRSRPAPRLGPARCPPGIGHTPSSRPTRRWRTPRSEEHTSELQSRFDLVCRLLLEKKKRSTGSMKATDPGAPSRRRPVVGTPAPQP